MSRVRATDGDDHEWGPKMAALANDRQRGFVCALFNAPKAKGRYMFAVQQAGYGNRDGTSSRKALSVIAARLAAKPAIQAAIEEESRRRLRSLPAPAILALERLLDKPDHKDHGRAISMILDRSDPVQTSHNIHVEHQHQHRVSVADVEKVEARIVELARRAGLRPAPPVVEAEYQVVSEDSRA